MQAQKVLTSLSGLGTSTDRVRLHLRDCALAAALKYVVAPAVAGGHLFMALSSVYSGRHFPPP
jgi:hypothetical protein